MRYHNYNNDLSLVVPLQDDGIFLGSLSGVASFTVVLSAGNNNGITISYDGSHIMAPAGVMAGVIGGSLHIYVNAQAVEASLGTGIVTANITINFYDESYNDGIRTSSMTQSMMVMLVDGDTPEEGSQEQPPVSFGALTITMDGVTLGTYNGTPTTIDIPAYEGEGAASLLVDGDTIVSENNMLKVAVGIKGVSFAYNSTGHSINLSQGGYAYSAVLPYANPNTAGLVNTYAQTFSGTKTFRNGVRIGDCVLTWDAASSSLVLSNAVTGEVVNLKMSGSYTQNYSAPILQLIPTSNSLVTDDTTQVTTTIIVKADNVADDAVISLSLSGHTAGFSVSPSSVTGAAAKATNGASVTFTFNPANADQTVQDVRFFVTEVTASITDGPSTSIEIDTEADFS